ncbi:hypothetical protein [Nevskia soli]|uniref:hypothetical protein n=1 Tax=Nevskia soli TaxID=418856 RepID=UPI0015D6F0E4|nr:hypothetical protein [Nevskia soli]
MQRTSFTKAWVDTPYSVPPAWLPNSVRSASEWITPYDGEGNQAEGWYVYITPFHVPSALPGGISPTSLTISGRFASDNEVYGFSSRPQPAAVLAGQRQACRCHSGNTLSGRTSVLPIRSP